MEEDFVWTIKDPFDKPHNPGRAKKESGNWIVDQFKYSYENLKNNDFAKALIKIGAN